MGFYLHQLFILLELIVLSRSLPHLVSVTIVSRHGDRGPLLSNANSPITHRGILRQICLGRQIRARYSSKLKCLFNTNNSANLEVTSYSRVRARSSALDRTLMSAQSCLQGILSEKYDREKNAVYGWSPVPVYTVALHEDSVLSRRFTCPTIISRLNELFSGKEVDEKMESFIAAIGPVLSARMKATITKRNIYKFADYVLTLSNEDHNGKFDWLSETFKGKLRELMRFMFATEVRDKLVIRLRGGPLIKDIINNWKNENGYSIFMYTAHDFTLGYLLSMLNFSSIYEKEIPSYGSAVIFELWKEIKEDSDQLYTIDIFYVNGPTPCFANNCCLVNEFQSIGNYSLKEFEHLMEPYISGLDVNRECGNKIK